ncbi:MAG: hypothetical protein C0401_09970 [Anaerolinea sp.]|nr:hypothetical protein [Anaerolinea sp.]
MQSKTKGQKGQVKEREQRRQQKLEKQRRKGKGTTHGPRPTRNQKEVAKRLLAGEVSMVGGTGWSFVEPFLSFLGELGFYDVIQIDGERFIRKMMAVSLLILTYEVKVLLGLAGMNGIGKTLFRDIALLKLIGYSTRQLQEGFCQRGIGDKQKPMHKNVLADAAEKLTSGELEYILNTSIQRLAAKGVFSESRGHFALDGSDLETTARYRDVGMKTVTKKWSRKEKKLVEIEKVVYGFKLLALYDVHLRLVVAVKVVQIQEHDSQFTRPLLQQGLENLGPGVIRVLLIDRGFLDGLTLWQIKNEDRVDFVVPVKSNMIVTGDARAFLMQKADGEYVFAAERPGEGSKHTGHIKLIGIRGLTTYDQYGDEEHQQQSNRTDFQGNPINAIVVTEFDHHVYAHDKAKVFLSSLPVDDPLAVIDLYDLRSLIENTLFRELKQGWFIGHFPKKTADAVRGHVFLIILVFNLTNAFRTHVGQDLTKRGIRRQRRSWQCTHQVIVFADEFYAVFDIETIFILLGRPPEICWRVDPDQVYRQFASVGLRKPNGAI